MPVLLEEIVHDVSVIWLIALRHVANRKNNDGVQPVTIVTCNRMRRGDKQNI